MAITVKPLKATCSESKTSIEQQWRARSARHCRIQDFEKLLRPQNIALIDLHESSLHNQMQYFTSNDSKVIVGYF